MDHVAVVKRVRVVEQRALVNLYTVYKAGELLAFGVRHERLWHPDLLVDHLDLPDIVRGPVERHLKVYGTVSGVKVKVLYLVIVRLYRDRDLGVCFRYDKVLLLGHAHERLIVEVFCQLHPRARRAHYIDHDIVQPALVEYRPRYGGPGADIEVVVVAGRAVDEQGSWREYMFRAPIHAAPPQFGFVAVGVWAYLDV